MSDTDRPRTEAGRALLDAANALGKQVPDGVPMSIQTFIRHAIPRIEAEAAILQPAAPAEGLREALALADSMIRSGERHTSQSEAIIRAALVQPAATAEGLDVERLIESIAYMGVIDIHQQVCAWCGMRYGYPHREWCPITAQAPVIRAALLAPAEGLREAASAIALDYHSYAITSDDSHPAVTWARCADPKCAALRAALEAER